MGSVGVMSVDACPDYGLEVADLSRETRQRLDETSPPWAKAENPLDIWPIMMTAERPMGETLRMLMGEVMGDPGVDGVLLFAGAWFEALSPPVTDVLREMAESFPGKPITWCPYEGWLTGIRADDLAERLAGGTTAVFAVPEDALRALARLAEYREFLDQGE
jgi:acyl-CoA synthetase (NDP forming)